jgi:hypothetical protein
MNSIQERHAPGARAVSRRGRPDAGECVTALRKISWLIRSCGGCVLARSPGDPASADGTRPALQIAISHCDRASEDSASVLGLSSQLRRAASFAGRSNGGQASVVASAARVLR